MTRRTALAAVVSAVDAASQCGISLAFRGDRPYRSDANWSGGIGSVAWPIVELFAGIGCVASAFAEAGPFEPVLLTDVDQVARDNVIANVPNANYLVGNVQDLRLADVLSATGGRPLGGLVGCPPCQGFSAAGQRDDQDRRNELLVDYFRLVHAARPAFFVMENVPSVFKYDLLRALLHVIDRRYAVWRGVLNAALYGLPQSRQRAIVVGYRRDLGVTPGPPQPTHLPSRAVFHYPAGRMIDGDELDDNQILGTYPHPWASELTFETVLPPTDGRPLVTVGEALSDLRPAANGSYSPGASRYAAALQGPLPVSNHEPWGHGPETVRRLAAIPEGGSEAQPEGKRYFSQAYGRLHRAGISRTITTNFHNAGSGRFLHPTEPRTITIREAARLQGISDGFRFVGKKSDHERLIGNAFPPPLARAIARRIADDLEGCVDQ